MRRHRQSAFHRLLGQQPGRQHHAGLLVLVQLVMAAMTTAPWPMPAVAIDRGGPARVPRRRGRSRVRPPGLASAAGMICFHVAPAARGPAAASGRPGSARPWPDPACRILAVFAASGRRRVRNKLLLLGSSVRPVPLPSSVRPVWRRYCKRLLVDGEKAHRGAVLGGHVGHRGAIGHASCWPRRRRNIRRTCPPRPSLRRICVTVSTRSVAVAPVGQLAGAARSRPPRAGACRAAGRA